MIFTEENMREIFCKIARDGAFDNDCRVARLYLSPELYLETTRFCYFCDGYWDAGKYKLELCIDSSLKQGGWKYILEQKENIAGVMK